MRRIIFAIFFFLFFFFPRLVFAEKNSFITIVNPQRISNYTKDYLESFGAEYKEIKNRDLPATWLLTYDVLARDDFVEELKNLNSSQELGILLEVTEPFANTSNIKYNKTDNWHRATSLFLSGYEQKDRIKLIDTVFELFKKRFGYYPKSVGSWWTDSFSQDYMRKKYGVSGNLGVSDQYDLDGYQVWGTWWSMPYYPSTINAAVPAQDNKNKLGILQFRWAVRDPLNGYNIKTNRTPSMYSLQDYRFAGLTDLYFQNLLELYALKKPYSSFGHATLGLEGDLSADIYSSLFATHLDKVKNLQAYSQVKVVTMQDFSDWYSKNFPNLSPKNIISADDLLGSGRKVFWFQNPYYRAGIEFTSSSNKTRIIDLREYYSNLEEPNYREPNKQFNLSINLPFKIDTVIKPDSAVNLDLGFFEKIEENSLIFEKGKIEFKEKEIVLAGKTIKIKNEYKIPEEGLVYKDYSYTIPFAIKSRIPIPEEYILMGILIIGGAVISIFKKKGIIAVLFFVFLLAMGSIIISPDFKFYISQDEYSALKVLEGLPNGPALSEAKGNVLVYEKDCVNCSYESKFKPAAMAGKKGYVSLYSQQPTEINFGFQIAKTSSDARKILKDKSIKYVYLSKYADSIETLPYLPQDLGLERVYTNANAEIWEVK